jgi:hypothetical protein
MCRLKHCQETKRRAVDWFAPAAERERQVQPQPEEFKLPLGPLKLVHAYWLAGISCDGAASIAACRQIQESFRHGPFPAPALSI